MYNICKTLTSVFHKNKNERISDTRGWHPSTIPFGCFKFDCAMLLSLILSLLKERKWELFFFRTIFTVVNLLYNSDTILIQRALKKKKIAEYFRLLNRTLGFDRNSSMAFIERCDADFQKLDIIFYRRVYKRSGT